MESIENALRVEFTTSIESLAARVTALEQKTDAASADNQDAIARLQKETERIDAASASQEELQQVQAVGTATSQGVAALKEQVQGLDNKNTNMEEQISAVKSTAEVAQQSAAAATAAAQDTAAQLVAAQESTAAEVSDMKTALANAQEAIAAGPSQEAVAAVVKQAAEAAAVDAAGPAVREAVASATADMHQGVAAVLQAALEAPDLKQKINEAVHIAALQHATNLAEGEVADDGSVKTVLEDAVKTHLASALQQPHVAKAMQEHVEAAKNTAVEASADSIHAKLSEQVQAAQTAAVAGALSDIDAEVAKQVAEKVAAAQASALEQALDKEAVDAMVASAVAVAVQQKVDAATSAATSAVGESQAASLEALKSAADELIEQLRSEKDALQAATAAEAPAAAPVDFSQWAALPKLPGTAVALQYPANAASAAQGAAVNLGEDVTTGTDMLARLTALVDECSELHPVPPAGKGNPIQSMLLSKTQGQASATGSIVATTGTAAKMTACAEAQQALLAYGTEGAKNNRNPNWLVHPSRPQPGQAWLVEKPAAKVTLQLPHASVLKRIGVLAPTSFQRGNSGAPACRPVAISAVCAQEDSVPAMLLSETDLTWNTEQDAAGEAFVEVVDAIPCGRVLVTVKSAGRQVCTHRLVLQE